MDADLRAIGVCHCRSGLLDAVRGGSTAAILAVWIPISNRIYCRLVFVYLGGDAQSTLKDNTRGEIMYEFEFTTQRGQVTGATIQQLGEPLATATTTDGEWVFAPVAGHEQDLATALAQDLEVEFQTQLMMATVQAAVQVGYVLY